jgi:uncharacterized protein YodC (DUF2158 family)
MVHCWLKPGNLVRHLSGGPIMMIEKPSSWTIFEPRYSCVWVENGRPQYGHFHLGSLQTVYADGTPRDYTKEEAGVKGSADDRYDPDRWMASGKNLGDFLPDGPGASQYYTSHPELGERVKRYWAIMCDAVSRAHQERNEFLVEEDLRELWRSTT